MVKNEKLQLQLPVQFSISFHEQNFAPAHTQLEQIIVLTHVFFVLPTRIVGFRQFLKLRNHLAI